MGNTIVISGKKIRYHMKRSRRARSVRLSISCSGILSVTYPWFVPDIFAERFVRSRADWILGKLAEMAGRETSPFREAGEREYLAHKDEALAFVTERVAYWNRRYGFPHGRISVRNQKTRWGSCSKAGNLSFNWRLALLPREMADYVVVHELCHLARFDHSPEFWSLVERAIPEYRDIRKRMKRL